MVTQVSYNMIEPESTEFYEKVYTAVKLIVVNKFISASFEFEGKEILVHSIYAGDINNIVVEETGSSKLYD